MYNTWLACVISGLERCGIDIDETVDEFELQGMFELGLDPGEAIARVLSWDSEAA